MRAGFALLNLTACYPRSVLPTIKRCYEHVLHSLDGDSLTGYTYYASGWFLYPILIGLHLSIVRNTPSKPLCHYTKRSLLNLRTVYHSFTDQQLIHLCCYPPSFPISKICKDLYLLMHSSQVDPSLQCCTPSMSPMICIPPSALYASTSFSFWGPFGIGAFMELW